MNMIDVLRSEPKSQELLNCLLIYVCFLYCANMHIVVGATAQAMQLAAAPPIVAGGIQTIVAPPHAPFSQPFAAIQPIVVPGGNGYFYH